MKRIRIIEDDTAIRTELKTLLQTNGYRTVEEDPCDLILMDVNLPGLKLLYELHHLEWRSSM